MSIIYLVISNIAGLWALYQLVVIGDIAQAALNLAIGAFFHSAYVEKRYGHDRRGR